MVPTVIIKVVTVVAIELTSVLLNAASDVRQKHYCVTVVIKSITTTDQWSTTFQTVTIVTVTVVATLSFEET